MDQPGGQPARGESPSRTRPVNLALQGGGAHGAFTWGVLDWLLADGRVEIEAISGTSAGAMNAAVVAEGLMTGGVEEARRALHDFWSAVSRAAVFSPIQRSIFDRMTGQWSLDRSPTFLWFDTVGRMFSPYWMNPLNLNPLRDLLAKQVDFSTVRGCDRIKLFISATCVRTGRIKVFQNAELTAGHVMASACLPYLFQAVEIDGEAYWDGGYRGNPALFPLIRNCLSRDVVIVQINPMKCTGTPKQARDIYNRMNEITFNGALMGELRSIDFVSRMVREAGLDKLGYKEMFFHMIDSGGELQQYTASSKLIAEWPFLTRLRDIGRRAAQEWMDNNFEDIGKKSSFDVHALFE
jgi:NTE family protein